MKCACCGGGDRPLAVLPSRDDVRLCRGCLESLLGQVGIDSAPTLPVRMTEAGLPVTPISDQPWGMREFTLTDPFGNRVRIGRGVD